MVKIILLVAAIIATIAGIGLAACYHIGKQQTYYGSCGHTTRGDRNA